MNASLYPSVGMTRHLASVGQFPPVFGRSLGSRQVPVGLLVMAGLAATMVLAFNLNSIASLGSAVALLVFSAVTLAHLKVYRLTGALPFVLIISLVATLGDISCVLHNHARQPARYRRRTGDHPCPGPDR